MEPDVIHDVVKKFLESKYGLVEVEVSRIYWRNEDVEVAGTFRRQVEKSWKRFTLLIDRKTLGVKAFGMR